MENIARGASLVPRGGNARNNCTLPGKTCECSYRNVIKVVGRSPLVLHAGHGAGASTVSCTMTLPARRKTSSSGTFLPGSSAVLRSTSIR